CFEKTIIIALPGDKKHHAMRIYLEKYVSCFLFISVLFFTLMFILFCTLTVKKARLSGNIVHPLLGSFFLKESVNNMFSRFIFFTAMFNILFYVFMLQGRKAFSFIGNK